MSTNKTIGGKLRDVVDEALVDRTGCYDTCGKGANNAERLNCVKRNRSVGRGTA